MAGIFVVRLGDLDFIVLCYRCSKKLSIVPGTKFRMKKGARCEIDMVTETKERN